MTTTTQDRISHFSRCASEARQRGTYLHDGPSTVEEFDAHLAAWFAENAGELEVAASLRDRANYIAGARR